MRLRPTLLIGTIGASAFFCAALSVAAIFILRTQLLHAAGERPAFTPAALSNARLSFAALSLVSIATAAAGSLFLARALTRPLDRLTVAARRWSHGEFAHRVETSGPREVEDLASALNSMAGSLWHRDDTIRLDAKDRIMESEKLATIGQLAAGVAHEINNPLGGILLYGNLLLESTDRNDPRRENMAKIVAQAERAKEIVRGLLDFSRQTPPRIERVDLNAVLLGALKLLERHPMAQNIEVRTELSAAPLWVQVDAPKIQQVFINIVTNAFEAMTEGGDLTIRSGFSERGGFCRVAITDTGPGIPEEHRGRLFEPFFTTKEAGHGVGLGLAISYGIVSQHGGAIEVQSAEGSGSTFRILLPVERTMEEA